MNIALYGASGMIGQRILRESLQRGHSVTAIMRDPAKLSEQHPNLKAVAGNILDPQSVANTVAGHDAVINATAPSHGQVETILEATRSLISALPQAGVKRLLTVGGAGSLEVAPGVQLADTPAIPEAWKPLVLAHRDALHTYRSEADALDWTYFSPSAMIQPGERTGTFRLGGDQLIRDDNGNSAISAEDYAIAVLDEIENPKHIKQRFTIGY